MTNTSTANTATTETPTTTTAAPPKIWTAWYHNGSDDSCILMSAHINVTYQVKGKEVICLVSWQADCCIVFKCILLITLWLAFCRHKMSFSRGGVMEKNN